MRCSIFLAFIVAQANAGVIFSDSFSAPGVGESALSSKWEGSGDFVIRNEAANAAFGATKFARIDTENVSRVARATIPKSGIATVQFDFSEPTAGDGGPVVVGFGKSGSLGPADAALCFQLDDGKLSFGANTIGGPPPYGSSTPYTYEVGTAYRVHVIFNRSGQTITYPYGVTQTLLNNQADIWIRKLDGTSNPIKAKTYASSLNAATADRLIFGTTAALPANTIDFDNVVIHNTLITPGTTGEAPEWAAGENWRSALYPENWKPPGVLSANFDKDPFLQDFSHAGYRGGNVEIPVVTGPEWVVTDTPFGADPTGVEDSTAAIQAAIDTAGAAGGGVVKLPAGTYRVQRQPGNIHVLLINTPNVILRGEGSDKTFLFNSGTEMRDGRVILVQGPAEASFTVDSGVSSLLTANLMGPATVLPVADASMFAVGDWVTVRTDTTPAWITEHGADTWVGHGAILGGFTYRRQVMAVDVIAKTVTIDIPTRYAVKTRDRARLAKIIHSGLTGVGLEDFAIGMAQRDGVDWTDNSYNNVAHTAWHVHSSYAISLQRTRDCWMSGVRSYRPVTSAFDVHLLSNGLLVDDSCRITVQDCNFQRTQYGGGGGNGYMMRVDDSSECLLLRCTAEKCRHGLVLVGIRCSGNVLTRCADKYTGWQGGGTGDEIAPSTGSDHHAHFSHSNLIDASTVEFSYFTAHYRPYGGIPQHGVTSAHSVFWNISGNGYAGQAVVRSQQARYGYVIGAPSVSLVGNGTYFAPSDWVEGVGMEAALSPASLYEDQVQRRLFPEPLTPLGEWRQRKFGVDAENELISGWAVDADLDGWSNLLEFAIDGEPRDARPTGKVSVRSVTVEDSEHLTITLPVREDAEFHGSGDLVSDPIDGVVYLIQGSTGLVDFTSLDVVELPSPLIGDMPGLSEGWEYRSFRLAADMQEESRAFLRMGVMTAPE